MGRHQRETVGQTLQHDVWYDGIRKARRDGSTETDTEDGTETPTTLGKNAGSGNKAQA